MARGSLPANSTPKEIPHDKFYVCVMCKQSGSKSLGANIEKKNYKSEKSNLVGILAVEKFSTLVIC